MSTRLFTTTCEMACPFCSGNLGVGSTEKHVGVTHTLPYCDEFRKLPVEEYLARVRAEYERAPEKHTDQTGERKQGGVLLPVNPKKMAQWLAAGPKEQAAELERALGNQLAQLPKRKGKERAAVAEVVRGALKALAQMAGAEAAERVLEQAGGWPAGCGPSPQLRPN